MRLFKTLCLLLLLPSLVSAQGVLGPAANPPDRVLYDYRNTITIQDEFLSGSTGNGTIGSTGFAFSGGTTAQPDSEANRFGIIRRDTSATGGTIATLSMLPGSATINPAIEHRIRFIARLNTNDANTTVRIGSARGAGTSPPANGIYFEKLDGDTDWYIVTRAASSETRVTTGVAVDTSFHTFEYIRTSAGVTFVLDGVPRGGVATATIPSLYVTPMLHITNSAAAAKTIDVDYFEATFAVTR